MQGDPGVPGSAGLPGQKGDTGDKVASFDLPHSPSHPLVFTARWTITVLDLCCTGLTYHLIILTLLLGANGPKCKRMHHNAPYESNRGVFDEGSGGSTKTDQGGGRHGVDDWNLEPRGQQETGDIDMAVTVIPIPLPMYHICTNIMSHKKESWWYLVSSCNCFVGPGRPCAGGQLNWVHYKSMTFKTI